MQRAVAGFALVVLLGVMGGPTVAAPAQAESFGDRYAQPAAGHPTIYPEYSKTWEDGALR